MAQMHREIDSIRVAAVCPDELTLILRQKGSESYVPIWLSLSQAEILANVLHGRLDNKEELDAFLASINATYSEIQCATVYLEDNTFFANVILWRHSGVHEVRCPIGLALALAVRANAPILLDDALFNRAGVCLSAASCESQQ